MQRIQRLLKLIKPTRIDMLLYDIDAATYEPQSLSKVPLTIEKSRGGSHTIYTGYVNGTEAHRSLLFDHTRLPGQFGYGHFPVIGGCVTPPDFRGQRIYPHVLNYIAQDVFSQGDTPKILILVAPDNHASIRGIERAGFQFVARLRGIRIGTLVLNRSGHNQARTG